MGTTTRPQLSIKNPYYVPKHRYYELKHFCLQYQDWKHELKLVTDISAIDPARSILGAKHKSDITRDKAQKRIFYQDKIDLVEESAEETDALLSPYLIKAVTEGLSYDTLVARYRIPCCKGIYYDLYRRFFYILSNKKR